MSFVESFKRKLYCWKYNLAKPGTLSYYRELCANQRLSPEEIEALSWEKTQRLLEYAYLHVPFYKKRFSSLGIVPQDIRTPGDYEKFPVLTRSDLMDNFCELLSDEYSLKDVRISTTGGSSGVPAKVCHPKKQPRAAMGWRIMDWWNLAPSVDMADVYRDVSSSWKARFLHWIQAFPGRQILLNATNFTERDMQEFLERFSRMKPQLLHGYVGAVDVLAEYMLEHNIKVPSPKAIWLTSAPITPVQQQRIEEAFGAPVYDQYGCCEIYWLAAECPQRQGLHFFQDIRRFEFVDTNAKNVPNGEYGDILITDLENYAFPLIRYANGDRGRRLDKHCSCGCNLPLMDKVKGRISETFVLPSGMRVNGEYLTTLFDDHPEAVKQFQVHQLADASVVLRVVPNQRCVNSDEIIRQVEIRLKEMTHHEVSVTVEAVESIPQRGGKLKFVISEYLK